MEADGASGVAGDLVGEAFLFEEVLKNDFPGRGPADVSHADKEDTGVFHAVGFKIDSSLVPAISSQLRWQNSLALRSREGLMILQKLFVPARQLEANPPFRSGGSVRVSSLTARRSSGIGEV